MSCENTRDIKVSVSADNIKDQIAALMYAVGVVKDNEEVVQLDLDWMSKDIVEISMKIKKDKEVEHIRLNG